MYVFTIALRKHNHTPNKPIERQPMKDIKESEVKKYRLNKEFFFLRNQGTCFLAKPLCILIKTKGKYREPLKENERMITEMEKG